MFTRNRALEADPDAEAMRQSNTPAAAGWAVLGILGGLCILLVIMALLMLAQGKPLEAGLCVIGAGTIVLLAGEQLLKGLGE